MSDHGAIAEVHQYVHLGYMPAGPDRVLRPAADLAGPVTPGPSQVDIATLHLLTAWPWETAYSVYPFTCVCGHPAPRRPDHPARTALPRPEWTSPAS